MTHWGLLRQKQTHKQISKQIPNSHLLLLDPEENGTAILQHPENNLPNETV